MDWLYLRLVKPEQERPSRVTGNPPETAILPRAGGVEDWREMAGIPADYETNPIVRQAGREAGLPPNFHGLALPPASEAGTGAGLLQ